MSVDFSNLSSSHFKIMNCVDSVQHKSSAAHSHTNFESVNISLGRKCKPVGWNFLMKGLLLCGVRLRGRGGSPKQDPCPAIDPNNHKNINLAFMINVTNTIIIINRHAKPYDSIELQKHQIEYEHCKAETRN